MSRPTTVNIRNLEAWAIGQGYDPNTDYTDGTDWPEGQLSENFKLSEFKCKCCGETHPDGVPQSLIDDLETIRAHFGAPVRITSGYRCPVHNSNVGGATNSQHLKGRAADIQVDGVHPYDVYKYANALIGDTGGVGRYNNFTHIDVRGYRARW